MAASRNIPGFKFVPWGRSILTVAWGISFAKIGSIDLTFPDNSKLGSTSEVIFTARSTLTCPKRVSGNFTLNSKRPFSIIVNKLVAAEVKSPNLAFLSAIVPVAGATITVSSSLVLIDFTRAWACAKAAWDWAIVSGRVPVCNLVNACSSNSKLARACSKLDWYTRSWLITSSKLSREIAPWACKDLFLATRFWLKAKSDSAWVTLAFALITLCFAWAISSGRLPAFNSAKRAWASFTAAWAWDNSAWSISLSSLANTCPWVT